MAGSANAGLAQAVQSPGLAFEDVRTWNVKWDVLGNPQREDVCNVSGATALLPDVAVTRLVAGEADPVDVLEVTLAAPAQDKSAGWQAGECRSVVLSRNPKKTLAAGSHTGVVTVTSSVGIARRTVTIAGPTDVATPAAAEGAVAGAELNATRNSLIWKKTSFDDGGTLLLKRVKDNKLNVPPCDPSKPTRSPTSAAADAATTTPTTTSEKPTTTSTRSTTAQTTTGVAAPATGGTAAADKEQEPAKPPAVASEGNCRFVGNLYNGTHVAKVFVADSVDDNDLEQPASLKLRLDNATQVGKYTGALDLAGTADPKDDIKLGVNVNDHWLSALGALVIGAVLFAWLPQGILRRRNPRKRTDARIDGFKNSYMTAIAAFNARPPETPLAPWQNPKEVAIDDIAEKLREAVRRYWKSTLYFDDTKEAYKELDGSLDYIEDDIACLGQPERLSTKLTALQEALDRLTKFLNKEFCTLEAPRFAVPLAALLKGPAPPTPAEENGTVGTLKVGQALATADAADDAIALIASWNALADEFVTYRKWWLRLKRDASQTSNLVPWEPSHLARLDHARSWLAQAEHELLNVADADELAQFDTAADLKRAYGHLAFLGDKHGGWPQTQETAPGDEAEEVPATEFANALLAYEFADPIPPNKEHAVRHWEAEAGEVKRAAARAPTLKEPKKRLVAAWLAVLLIATSAVAAALSGFYFSENWGTTEDYVTIMVAAVLAQVVVTTIVEAVGRTLLPMPKQLLTGPVAAILKPPAAKAAAVQAGPKPDAA